MKNPEPLCFNIDEKIEESVQAAYKLFFSGKIFIYPTDTIYGIGCNPEIKIAVQRITDIKGRDEYKKFIFLISDLENLLNFAEVTTQKQLAFLKLIWPGPVSVILNLNSRAKKLLDQEEAAFRIPRNIFCQKLLKKIKLPLISTSVNRSGQEPLNNPEAIKKEFYDVDAIFYSEQKSLPAASTIIDLRCEKPVLVREGAINFVELFEKFK